MSGLLRRVTASGLALALLVGCQTSTVIKTRPAGGEVFVNLVRVGKTPATWTARTGLPDTARVRVSLEGYQTVRDVPLEKRYHADLSLLWLIPGIIPYFFTARFDDELVIPLEPVKPIQNPR